MENVSHVKPKSAWKKVELDPSFFTGIDFAGPTYIQVLEDYSISSLKNNFRSSSESIKLREKRKLEHKKKKFQAIKQELDHEQKVVKGDKLEKQNGKKKKKNQNQRKSEKKGQEEDIDLKKGKEDNSIKQKEKKKFEQAKKKNQKKSADKRQEGDINLKKSKEESLIKQKQKNKLTPIKKQNKDRQGTESDISEDDSKEESKGSSKKNQKRKYTQDEEDSSPKKKSKIVSATQQLEKIPKKKKKTVLTQKERKELWLQKLEKDKNMAKEKPTDMELWDELFVPNEVLWALKEHGFTAPTHIQARTLPSAIRDKMDIVGAAETGSGKTLAFGIPVIHYLLQARKRNKNKKTLPVEESMVESDDEQPEDLDVLSDEGDENSESEPEEETDFSLKDIVGLGEEDGSDNDDDDEEEEEDIDDDEEEDDDGIEQEEDIDIDEGVSEGESDEADDDSTDEKEIQDLPENELGCVRVVKDVDFSWIENEKKEVIAQGKTHPFALILEPTRELAMQVKNHLNSVAKYTDIKIATIVGGMSVQKQRRVLKHCPDIIVATPGRLWDLIGDGEPYLSEIEKSNILIIDEADRMVQKGHFEELESLLLKMNRDPKISAKRHTYVFSATLTTVHEGPQRFNKRKKNKLVQMSETQKLELLMASIGLKSKPKIVDLTRKFGTVETLTEARIHCSNEEKDIYLYYFLKQYPGRTLVFCNSKDCIRRLVSVFNYLKCTPLPLHADMHQRQRLKNLDKFTGNPRGVLIASDVAARGLDIPNVQHVIHFQVPNIVENYIHRSGRTARASKEGLSIMFIGPNDMKSYKKIINTLNRDEELPLFPVEPEYLTESKQRVELVRKIETQEYRFNRGKRQNDWFKKMAEESGIDIDDENLLADIGDEQKQADHKRSMKHYKAQLDYLLKQPIVPKTMGGKYPTKTGRLAIPIQRIEAGGAIAHLKTDKKRQDKYIEHIKNKPLSSEPQKKKKDKWKKKKWQRTQTKDDKKAE